MFGDQVDFIHLDWDSQEARELLKEFGILRRSSYLLISPDSEILWQWVGELNGETVTAEFDRVLKGISP
jgi:hypothetical protein